MIKKNNNIKNSRKKSIKIYLYLHYKMKQIIYKMN